MVTKFKMIKEAEELHRAELRENATIIANVIAIADQHNFTPTQLHENATHILANIAMNVEDGQPIKVMHVNSVAAFMAGIEAIANALPDATDERKKQNTLRVLAASGLDEFGQINDSTFPIVNLGARKEKLKAKYQAMIQQYMVTQARGTPRGMELAQEARRLQLSIDRAMRSAAQSRSVAPAGPSVAGSSPSHV